MRTIIIILTILTFGQIIVHGQSINNIDKVKLNLPCKLEMVYNESSLKSYLCQTLTNNIPVSYRVTINSFSSNFQKLDKKGKRAFIEMYLNGISNDAQAESKNVKSRTFYNFMAVQFDDFVDMGDMILQTRTFVFLYKEKSISFNYVSSPTGFDERFEKFLNNINLIE